MKLVIEALKRGQYLPIVASGVVGAAIGWVVAEVLVYQLFDKKNEIKYIDVEVPVEYDKGTENNAPVIMTKEERKQGVIKVNYAEKFKEGKLQPIPPKDETMIDDPEDIDDENFEQGPYVITEEEFEMQEQANKYHFVYYEDDDVLTDDKDRIVPDYEDNIGIEALSCFGESSDDPDVVYIQNDDENNVYEIIRIHSSYEAMVTGTVASKIPVKKSNKPRKKKVVSPLEDEDEE
jgi:hypothetical protein